MTQQDILDFEQRCSESKIQHICVSWFRHTFPKMSDLLFAVPNGGFRGARTGAQMVYEGQVRGVADLILLVPSGGKASLCIEMKTPKRKGRSAGVQSAYQKAWQELAQSYGNTYVVCHGLFEFVSAFCDYFQIESLPIIKKATEYFPLYIK